jgi:hypothetical protein
VSVDEPLVKVVVTAPHKHGGQWRTIGAIYDTTEANARDLIALGFATRAKPRSDQEQKQRYLRRDMRARK